ncbi:MAG TPA: hypothetical protein DCF47_07740 [Kandleria vitulina]|nr:hypothetical protein [Kandleria vitulina]
MYIPSKEQMDEAIARLDLLGLSNQFLLEGQYQISSHQELFLIEDNEIIEMIRQFEKANRSYVYHTIAYDTSEGTYIVCLHVSPQSSHWKEERRQLMKQKAIAFCFLADQLNHNGMFDLSLDEHLEVRKMRPLTQESLFVHLVLGKGKANIGYDDTINHHQLSVFLVKTLTKIMEGHKKERVIDALVNLVADAMHIRMAKQTGIRRMMYRLHYDRDKINIRVVESEGEYHFVSDIEPHFYDYYIAIAIICGRILSEEETQVVIKSSLATFFELYKKGATE